MSYLISSQAAKVRTDKIKIHEIYIKINISLSLKDLNKSIN